MVFNILTGNNSMFKYILKRISSKYTELDVRHIYNNDQLSLLDTHPFLSDKVLVIIYTNSVDSRKIISKEFKPEPNLVLISNDYKTYEKFVALGPSFNGYKPPEDIFRSYLGSIGIFNSNLYTKFKGRFQYLDFGLENYKAFGKVIGIPELMPSPYLMFKKYIERDVTIREDILKYDYGEAFLRKFFTKQGKELMKDYKSYLKTGIPYRREFKQFSYLNLYRLIDNITTCENLYTYIFKYTSSKEEVILDVFTR